MVNLRCVMAVKSKLDDSDQISNIDLEQIMKTVMLVPSI
jgi:hypothetical protein